MVRASSQHGRNPGRDHPKSSGGPRGGRHRSPPPAPLASPPLLSPLRSAPPRATRPRAASSAVRSRGHTTARAVAAGPEPASLLPARPLPRPSSGPEEAGPGGQDAGARGQVAAEGCGEQSPAKALPWQSRGTAGRRRGRRPMTGPGWRGRRPPRRVPPRDWLTWAGRPRVPDCGEVPAPFLLEVVNHESGCSRVSQ